MGRGEREKKGGLPSKVKVNPFGNKVTECSCSQQETGSKSKDPGFESCCERLLFPNQRVTERLVVLLFSSGTDQRLYLLLLFQRASYEWQTSALIFIFLTHPIPNLENKNSLTAPGYRGPLHLRFPSIQ